MIHQVSQIITGPASEPLTVATVCAHLRVPAGDDDAYIASLITEARDWVERLMGVHLMSTTIMDTLDRFPLLPNSQFWPGNPNIATPVINNDWPLSPASWAIELFKTPVQSITTFKYYDNGGVLVTLDPSQYLLDAVSAPARVAPALGGFWPSCAWVANAIQISYVAGYPMAAAIPPTFLRAIKLAIGFLYDNRNAGIGTAQMDAAMRGILTSVAIPRFG